MEVVPPLLVGSYHGRGVRALYMEAERVKRASARCKTAAVPGSSVVVGLSFAFQGPAEKRVN